MGDLSDTIKNFIRSKKVNIDNIVFKLHYKVTVTLLLTFSFFVTSKQYFGNPIECDTDGKVDKEFMDTYCWIYSTFIIKTHLKSQVGINSVAPGVGASEHVRTSEEHEDLITHKYYQWVFVVLLIQAAFFYLPRYIWKSWEGGRMQSLISEFRLGVPTLCRWDDKNKDAITRYFQSNHHVHNIYTIRYIICEFYNLINVVSQIFLVNWFLGGRFATIGLAVLDRSSTLAKYAAFPKVAKCTYEKFGPSGSLQLVDALCILPLNVLNEITYAMLWWWMLTLASITLICIIYRLLTVYLRPARTFLLAARVHTLTRHRAALIVRNLSPGDWFVLYQMNKNTDPGIFEQVLLSLEHRSNSKRNPIKIIS